MKHLLILFLTSSLAYGQVGINTENPQGVFNIDGKSTAETTNPRVGSPTPSQLADDFIVTETGATGIGGIPDTSAILDLQATNKGFLTPRVALNSKIDVTTIENPSIGLLVYNLGTNPDFNYIGYVFWNGSEWRSLNDSTVIAPEIESLVCSSVTLSPSSWKENTNYVGNLKVSYKGGNGGSYQPGSSFTVNGLTFTLRPGKLEYGEGELNFSVNGTPINSSNMTLPLSNSIIPFLSDEQSCTATIINQATADIKNVAVMGYPINSGDGYSLAIQTPDGKYRIRVWWNVSTGDTRGRPNVQIYNNSDSSKTLFWNYDTVYGGLVSSAGNSSTIPPGIWGGFQESNTWYPITTPNNAYWGNEGIMDANNGGPEYRRYSWIDDSPNSKVEYSAFIMAGATVSGNPTPNQTKVFIKLEQVLAQ